MKPESNVLKIYPDGRFITEDPDGYRLFINAKCSLPGVFLTPLQAEFAYENYVKEENIVQAKRNAGTVNAGGRKSQEK